MANVIAKLYKVRVVPKDLKSIPAILPYNQFIEGEPKDVELTKMEIMRCMNFGDVFMMEGEEAEGLPINTETFKELESYEEAAEGDEEDQDTDVSGGGSETPGTETELESEPVVEPASHSEYTYTPAYDYPVSNPDPEETPEDDSEAEDEEVAE